MKISVIITSFNEGNEVQKTIESIVSNTNDAEVILVDDASTDGSCDQALEWGAAKLIRHSDRIGIAPSRNDGVAAATGECFAFLDAHQRLTNGCLDQCADLAVERQSIVWPDVTGTTSSRWIGHGAKLTQKGGKKNGLFEGQWKRTKPSDQVSRCSTMIVPGYVIPRTVWPKVHLINGLRLHGASEPALSVKAFFADVPILHLCGPIAYHFFREGHKMPYTCSWRVTARNHALVARVCFDDSTWREYWAPKIFRRHLKDDGLKEFDQPHIVNQHEAFQTIKKRPDEEFWRGLMQEHRAA